MQQAVSTITLALSSLTLSFILGSTAVLAAPATTDDYSVAGTEAFIARTEAQCKLAPAPTASTIRDWPELYHLDPDDDLLDEHLVAAPQQGTLPPLDAYIPYASPHSFAEDPVEHTRLILTDPDRWPTYVIREQERNWIDQARDFLHDTATGPVVWFDNFFAVKRSPGTASHDFRLTPKLTCSDLDGCRHTLSIKSRVTLPNTEKKLRLLLTNDDPDTLFDSLDRRTSTQLKDEERNPFSAALSWALRTGDSYNINISSGLQARTPIRAFVQASSNGRAQLNEKMLLSAGQSIFYRSDEGFGARTQLDLDQSLREDVNEVVRWRQRYDFSEEFRGMDWTASVEYLRQVNRDRAWGLGAAADGNVYTAAVRDSYKVWFRFRKRFYREWLFWEFQPFVRWEKNFEFKADPGAAFSIEIYFDKES